MTVPFALSIHSFVNSIGSYVGFASIVAVAILILLYFAHARETATLRERLDQAQQRIGGLEARVAQLMQQGAVRGRGPAPVVPAPVPPPVPVRAPGAPQGSVRRIPHPATAAAAATAAPASAVAPLHDAAPSAPAGVAAPALASATRQVGDRSQDGGAPDDTMVVTAAAAAAAAASGPAANGRAEHTAVLAPAATTAATTAAALAQAPAPAPAPAPVTAAATAPVTAAAAAPVSASAGAPPRVRIGAERDAAEVPAPAAARVRRIGGHPQPAAVLPAFDDESLGGGRFSGALLPLLIAAVAVAVIIAGLIVITNSNNSTSGNVSHGSANATGQSLHNRHTAPPPFHAGKVTVAVLNGTAQSGLAGDVGKKLGHDGYRQGNIANAASQTQRLTFVYYVAGRRLAANRLAAQHVAKALALPGSRVRRATPLALSSCAISATGTALGSCSAEVIVSVGQDRVNLASG